jgi:NlpC/P60 family putative phage cell wall peptidase
MTGERIVAEARKIVGTPYHHGAHLIGVGCDCIGVILITGLAIGCPEAQQFIDDPLYKAYSRAPNESLLYEAADKYLDRVSLNEMQLGDIPVMVYDNAPQHFGIISAMDPRYLIHAYAQNRRVQENRIDATGQRRIVRLYRFRGLNVLE